MAVIKVFPKSFLEKSSALMPFSASKSNSKVTVKSNTSGNNLPSWIYTDEAKTGTCVDLMCPGTEGKRWKVDRRDLGYLLKTLHRRSGTSFPLGHFSSRGFWVLEVIDDFHRNN